jgi:uroporphyrinogen III methyltransferase/synthase
MTKPMGTIYLVGSGPGDIAYLTVRGQQLLTQAEVLIYDALVDAELLQWVPVSCLQLDVGKRGGQPSMPQSDINRLLVQYCQQGKQVVRLKSGDPFIFGRCTSEIQALIAADCPFEVIPGISSALAAPLLAGIPLTDPVLSRCFAVFSAHDPETLDWEALAQMDTLVILMGGKHLSEIIYQLQRHGRSPQTPIAIIRWAGRPHQQIWTGTLTDILEKTAGNSLSPIIITIGEVVRLRDYLQSSAKIQPPTPTCNLYIPVPSSSPLSSPSSPLTGKTVLVTRSAGQSSEFSDRLQQQGSQVIEMPTLEIVPPSSWEALDQAITQLQEFSWLILTSTNGVDYFFERLAAQGRDARSLAGVKIAVVGQKTALSLKQHGLQPDFVPPNFVADSLVEHFPEPLAGQKVLFPRVETGGREVLVAELTAKNAEIVEVAAYQSRCPEAIAPAALAALQHRAVDVITFASSKTVKNFCHLLEQSTHAIWQSWLAGVCLASIGPQTSKTCQELLGRVDVEAEEYTLEGLTEAIVQWATASNYSPNHSEITD